MFDPEPTNHPSRGDAHARRDFLRAAGAGLLGAGLAESNGAAAQNPAHANAESPSAAPIRAFYESLTMEQRRRMCFDWDHRGFTGLPLRLHVTNNWAISPASLTSFTDAQQRRIEDILASVLAPGWLERLKRQARDDTGQTWGAGQKIALFGRPESGPCQCVVTGFHLTLRATCERQPSVAFHGALCHGHQPSGFDEKVGHPNNFFWFQAQLANQVYQALDRDQRKLALATRNMPFYMIDGKIDRRHILPNTQLPIPLEPDVRFQGAKGTFPGMPIRDMNREQKLLANLTLDGILQPYRREYQDQVRRCLERQGGLDACSMAFYQERDLGADGEWDNWRIEGPAFVWYFRGAPHVHAWFHVADNPETPVTSHFG